MNEQRIKKPILILLSLVVLILLVICIFSIYWIQSDNIETEVKSLLNGSQDFFQKELEHDAEIYNGLLYFIKKDTDLQSAWLARDRDALVRHASTVFEEIRSKYRVTHFYFIDQEKICFLRMHNLSRHGDTIDRFTLDEAVREEAPSYGIELGPFGIFTLRVVHPWRIGEKIIGYIELGEEIDHITPRLAKALGVELFLTIKKSYLDRVKWEEGMKMMGHTGNWDELHDLVFMENKLLETNTAFRKRLTLLHEEHEDHLFKTSLNKLIYKGGFVDLLDAGGRGVADLIVLKDVTGQEASLINLITLVVLASIIIGGLLIFFFYWLLDRLEHRLVTINDGLKQEVAEHKHTEILLRESEEQLIKTKDHLDNIIESSVDAIVVADRVGNITRVNKSFLVLVGFKEEEMIGKHTYDFPPTESGTYESTTGELVEVNETFFSDTKKMLEKLFEEGKIENRESYFVRKDRKIVPIEENIVLLYDEEKNILGSVGIIRDITDRKKADKEIIEGKNFLEDVFNTNADGIMVTDKQGCIIKVNRAIEQMLGFRENELTGKYTVELGVQTEESKKTSAVMLEELFDKGFVNNFEAVWHRKDGSLCSVAMSITFIKDNEGNISGSVGSIKDITYRKQIEEEHSRLTSAVEQATEMIMVMVPEGNIKYINPAVEKIMGYSREEIIDQNIFKTGRGIYDKKFYQEIQKKITKGTVWSGNITYKKKDGSRCECKMTVSPIRDRSGKIINFAAIGRDITKELKLEKQLQQAQKMEAVGTLAGGVAHDLNNILSGILSYPELLLLDLPPESPLRKPILTIKRSGEKATAIVQDMLTLARRGVAITEVVNLNDIISDYLISPEFEKLKSFHPNIQLKTKFEKSLLNVLGSPVHLSKTVMNLISNAAEALVTGGDIEISTTNKYVDRPIKGYDEIEEGDYAILKISDTGIGISSEDMERIFEPFYTKKMMGRSGTGLGMAVVWGTVKDHKGYIAVKSVEGKGTTFTLYFPATRKELSGNRSLPSIEGYRGRGEKILIVDDVNEQREIASSMLDKLGYSVTTVSSGEEAIEYIKNTSVDLLVLDMIMDPGIDGLETYQKILEIHPDQKAVIASGFSETDRVKEVRKIGAGAYIKKPYTLEKIGVAVKKELQLPYSNI